MKKSLIALAVASVFIAPAAWAQISLYGKAHLSLDMHDSGLPGAAATNTSLTSTGSRLGFRASEKLSDDLSANVGIETTIGFDSSGNSKGDANKLGDRGVGVSLSSKSMGTVNAGFGGTPLKGVTRGMDLFDGTVGANDGLMANRKTFNDNGPNGIGYSSPSISGVSVTVGKGLTESTGSHDGPLHLLARYKAGPADVFITQSQAPSATAVKYVTRSGGGSYSMGDLTAIVIYETNTNTDVDAKITTFNGTYLGGKYNISKTGAIKVAYTTIGNSATTGVTKINGDKQIVAGYDHNLSKDTKVYALASSLINNAVGSPRKTIMSLGLMKNF